MHRRLDTVIYIVSAVFLIGALSIWWQGVRPTGAGGEIEVIGPIPGYDDASGGRSGNSGHSSNPGNSGNSGNGSSGAAEQGQSSEPADIVVHVGGAVRAPGIYTLKEGQRVHEAVALAGPEEDADLDLLNLAALLKDSQKIIVPRKGDPAPPAGSGSSGSGAPSTRSNGSLSSFEPAFPININTATASELEALPGIGPSLAAAIIGYRERFGPFRSAEELKKVSGIGEKTFAKIAPMVVAE